VIYLITFACYGCHLHGDESGSVDREHSLPGTPVVETNPQRMNRIESAGPGMEVPGWLWKPQSVSAAIRYVVDEQGDPMAVFEAIEF
jgi:hypothetical protein